MVKNIIDLSVPLTEQTQTYPGDPAVRFEQHATVERDGFNLLAVHMGSQSGTHVDAPLHFDDDTASIDQLPLSRFIGRAVRIDARSVGARGRITREIVSPYLELIEPGDIVLLHTGWSDHFGTEAYFENPFLDRLACEDLLNRGVRTFGIDALNIDETPDDEHPGEGFPVHHLIAQASGVIIENLTNLSALVGHDVMFSALPLAFVGADGAPVRAVAWPREESK